MLWLALTLSGIGAALGFWSFRVHLVVAGSVALALLCVAIAPVAQWTPLQSVGYVLALAGAFQCGYFIGIVLVGVPSRAKRVADNPVHARHPTVPG